jgi:hypothetical protein
MVAGARGRENRGLGKLLLPDGCKASFTGWLQRLKRLGESGVWAGYGWLLAGIGEMGKGHRQAGRHTLLGGGGMEDGGMVGGVTPAPTTSALSAPSASSAA